MKVKGYFYFPDEPSRSLFTYVFLFSSLPGTITAAFAITVLILLQQASFTNLNPFKLHKEPDAGIDKLGILYEVSVVTLVGGLLQMAIIFTAMCHKLNTFTWKLCNVSLSLVYITSLFMFITGCVNSIGNIYILYYLILICLNCVMTVFLSLCLHFPQFGIDPRLSSDVSNFKFVAQRNSQHF